MSKKLIVAASIVGLFASAGVAFAQATATTLTPTTTTTAPATTVSQQPVLNVAASGNVLLRGTVVSTGSGTVTVKSWGGDWTVNVPASAAVLPSGTALSSFQAGDFVGVQGTVNSSANWTVDATLIRDWTVRAALRQQIKTNVQQAHTTMSSGPRVTQGTLSNLEATAQTFTLTTSAGTAYTVTLGSGAELIGKNWATITLSQVNTGDTVRVYGTVSGSAITASVFRDVTVK
ncbi:MAG: hypothetical protein KGI73_04395 [Patescibacteria group bacterium]|nr:hypothetical protein [Patescibacteria group bacterium]